MIRLNRLLRACAPLAALATLAACSGGDTQDRLDLADPAMRFVHAAPAAPAVTLYRGESAQSDATNVSYPSASNYFDISTDNADWTLKTAVGATVIGTLPVNASRGNKYTLVALPATAAESALILFSDPYNKSLSSDNARVRVVNASGNAASVDVYLSALGADITPTSVTPTISATAYRSVGPPSGSDSIEVSGGSYQLIVTPAGSKTTLFKGRLEVANNKDLLMVLVPDAARAGAVKPLVKVEGTPGLIAVLAD